MMEAKKHPNTLLLIVVILAIVACFTWILPSGEFQREIIDGRTMVVAGTYKKVSTNPQGIMAFLNAPIKGFIDAAQIIGFIFIVGGAFEVLNKTNAIDAGLQQVLRWNENRPAIRKLIIPVVMVLFSLAGATFGMSEAVLVFVLITIPLAISLGYDSIVGISISFLAAGVGFAAALTNPFTIGIAQGIAELPLFSGWEYRLFIWVIFTSVAIWFVTRYMNQLENGKRISPVSDIDAARAGLVSDNIALQLTTRRKIVLFLFLMSLGIIIYGVNRLGWYINEIVALFFSLGLLSSIIGKLSISETTGAFVSGASKMMMAALVVALSKGILVIASDGKIIDTMLNYVAVSTDSLPKGLTVQIMFMFQGVLNFFMPSGSGQAALTMPVMTPLSDLVGINRQTAVLAFQFGDGLFNMIIPTSGVTMGVLGIAEIPFKIWLKWALPLVLIFVALSMILLLLPLEFFNWGPF